MYYVPIGGRVDDRGVVVMEIVLPKEEELKFSPEVFHMILNFHYRFRPYYHDDWCSDIIQMMPYHLHRQRNLNHLCVWFL